MGPFQFLLATLAVWRVTHALSAEDGPWDLFVRLRRALGDCWTGRMLGCFNCLSVWLALPLAVVLETSLAESALSWLAISGAACLLQRIGAPRETPPVPVHWEEEEESDALLRKRGDEVQPARDSP